MRALIVLCLTLTIQLVLCEDTGLFKYNDVKYKSYKDILHPKVAIWSSKWQSKKGLYPKKASSYLQGKRPNTDARSRDYTAFAPYDENNRFIDVPDSPYFPIDHHFQQRTRIKKVLPEYYPSLSRVRRQAPKQGNKPEAKKVPSLKGKVKGVAGKVSPPVVKVKGKLLAKAPAKTPGKAQGKKAARTLAKGSAKLPRPPNKVRQAVPNAARNSNKRQKSVRQALRKRKSNNQNQNRKKKNRNRRARGQNKNQRAMKQPNSQKNQNQAGRRKVKPNLAKTRANQAGKPAAQQKDTSARRLISSRDADIEEFPYVVSIQKDSEHWCSGALLNQRMVVTTANCVWKSSHVSRMRVRVGSRHLDHGGQKVGIQEVMKHPHWSIRRNPDNDVALLLLDREVKFSDSVHAADLPNRVMMPPFDDAWVTSWGTERRDGVYKHQEKTLQMYHARLMDLTKCNNITRRYGVLVTENFICLAQDGHRAPCTRDTGAPAVSDGIVWGLASWSIRKLCGTEKFPAVFSYLGSSSNLDFIMNATHYLMADQRYNPFPDHLPRAVGNNVMG